MRLNICHAEPCEITFPLFAVPRCNFDIHLVIVTTRAFKKC